EAGARSGAPADQAPAPWALPWRARNCGNAAQRSADLGPSRLQLRNRPPGSRSRSARRRRRLLLKLAAPAAILGLVRSVLPHAALAVCLARRTGLEQVHGRGDLGPEAPASKEFLVGPGAWGSLSGRGGLGAYPSRGATAC